jgi:hypothetical protein
MSRRCLDSTVREMSIFEPSHCRAELIQSFNKRFIFKGNLSPPLTQIGTGLLASEPNDQVI